LPYLEQNHVYAQYHGYDQASPVYYDSTNLNGAAGKHIKQLLCPADITPNKLDGWPSGNPAQTNVTYHNYVVNFGNTGIDESSNWQATSYNGVTFKGAPFTLGKPKSIDSIADGSATTLMLSEVVIGQRHDLRGLTWWSTGAGFSSALRPNDSAPDRSGPYVFGARSRHTTGVNAAFCDGHVSFITNRIDPVVWQALSTTNGGEPVGSGY
jgi:prepilin-type processing-associated H-X9-DG protein